eukprot:TRINITY_DN15375_c0_g1_i1.p1 TRINITY_DN15375_c0_g1~~TRINITY_DN15375_c0_g1_i1.p1  ORF type:complete len:430 (+),score=52.82 TRINITY_DN15375_c0_g1_i1:49-1338(+)
MAFSEHRIGAFVLKGVPECGLAHEPPHVELSGCTPKSEVTLHLRIEPENSTGAAFVSSAAFIADENGSVDLSTHAPIRGSYKGVDLSGLWWSVKAAPDAPPGSRFSNRDARHDRVAVLSAKVADLEVCLQIKLRRRYLAESVNRKVLNEFPAGPVGVLFEPTSQASCPAILLIGGSAGELLEAWGAMLASHGFTAFCLRFIGQEPLPKSPDEVDLGYIIDACGWLAQRTQITQAPVLMGHSAGAQLALAAACAGAVVSKLVLLSPSHVRTRVGDRGFSLRGSEVPTVQFDVARARIENGELELRDATLWWLNETEEVLAAEVPCEQLNCPVLAVSGSDDRDWASEPMTRKLMQRLNQPCRSVSHHLCYAGAGHFFEPPLIPLLRAVWHRSVGGVIAMGGEPKAQHEAQADLWPRLLAFLRKYETSPARL